MAIAIGEYQFERPYDNTASLQDCSGVYVILCHRDNQNFVIDVGESATVRTRVGNHDRQACWQRNCSGKLTVAVLHTPNLQSAGRVAIEQEIRRQYDPPCGER